MILAAVVLLLQTKLTPAAEAVSDEWIEQSERVVLGSVSEVIRVRGIDVARIAVERTFIGPEKERSLAVLAVDAEHTVLAAGRSYLLFLERDRDWMRRSERVRRSLAALAGGGRILVTLSGSRLSRATDESGTRFEPVGRCHLLAPQSFASDAVLAELERRIDTRLPMVEIGCPGLVSPVALRVNADRSMAGNALAPGRADPADEHKVSEECWKALWSRVDERFLALPEDVGRSPGPDAPCRTLLVRTRRGPKRVMMHAWDPTAAADPVEREQIESALAVWEALAGAQARER